MPALRISRGSTEVVVTIPARSKPGSARTRDQGMTDADLWADLFKRMEAAKADLLADQATHDEFREEDHPRAPDGRFGNKAGEHSTQQEPEPTPPAPEKVKGAKGKIYELLATGRAFTKTELAEAVGIKPELVQTYLFMLKSPKHTGGREALQITKLPNGSYQVVKPDGTKPTPPEPVVPKPEPKPPVVEPTPEPTKPGEPLTIKTISRRFMDDYGGRVTMVTLSDGSKHLMQRQSGQTTQGLGGWHEVGPDTSNRPSYSWLGNTEAEAAQELLARKNKARGTVAPPPPPPPAADTKPSARIIKVAEAFQAKGDVIREEHAKLKAQWEALDNEVDALEYGTTEWDNKREQRNKVAEKLNEATDVMLTYRAQGLRKAVQDAMALPPEHQTVGGFVGAVRAAPGADTHFIQPKIDAAQDFLRKMIHKDRKPFVSVVVYPGTRRALYRDTSGHGSGAHVNAIHVGEHETTSVICHEIVHDLEHRFPEVYKQTEAFLHKRAGDQPVKNLRNLTGSNGYDADEVAFEDEWKKRGGSHYCGRKYNHKATELLSMGVERMIQDPLGFAAQDPDYFDLCMRIFQDPKFK